MYTKKYIITLWPAFITLVGICVLLAYMCGYIGHAPQPGERYTYQRWWYQSNPNPFAEHYFLTNTIIAVKNGYVLSVDNLGYTNVDHLTTFRFVNNLRVK